MAETVLSRLYHALGAWGRTVHADAEDASRQPVEVPPTLIPEPAQAVGKTTLVPLIKSVTINGDYGAVSVIISRELLERINKRIYRFKSEGCIVSHEEKILEDLKQANSELTDEQLAKALGQLKNLCREDQRSSYRA